MVAAQKELFLRTHLQEIVTDKNLKNEKH